VVLRSRPIVIPTRCMTLQVRGPMIPFDMSVSFITGQTLALSARRQLAHDDNLLVNKTLMISLLWMSLISAPSAMYFYHGWTAWNSVYIFKGVPISGAFPEYPYFESWRLFLESILTWLDCTVLIGLFIGAFMLGHHWILARQEKRIIITCVVVALALLAYLLLTYRRSFLVTTYEHFERLTQQPVSLSDVLSWHGFGGNTFLGHGVFWSNVVIAFIDFGPLIYLYRKFSREA
jgi:hypothetical protein